MKINNRNLVSEFLSRIEPRRTMIWAVYGIVAGGEVEVQQYPFKEREAAYNHAARVAGGYVLSMKTGEDVPTVRVVKPEGRFNAAQEAEQLAAFYKAEAVQREARRVAAYPMVGELTVYPMVGFIPTGI